MDLINIQLKQLTTEPDYTPLTPQPSNPDNTPSETYYELLRDAPDNYFAPPIQQINTTQNPETPHSSCNQTQPPLLDDDLTEHIQFDKERNLSYLPISTSLTLKRKRHMY